MIPVDITACAGLGQNAPRFNLRDYGGYATRSGGRLRRGVLFRSGQLDQAGPAESGLLRRLGIGVVVDLRGPGELGAEPSSAFDGFEGEVLVAASEDHVVPHATGNILAATSQAEVDAAMIATYRALPGCRRFQEALAHYLGALDVAGSRDASGTLIHCFAGKDRTGLAVALFHFVAGVHRDDLFADYLMTNAMGPERIELGRSPVERHIGVEMPAWLLPALMAVHADYLAAGLDMIEREHGGIIAYMAAASGRKAAEIAAIGERWID